MVLHAQPSSEPVELVRLDCPRTGDTVQISYGADIESYVSMGYADEDPIEFDLDTAVALHKHWQVAIRSANGVDPTLWDTTDLPIEIARVACPRTNDVLQVGYGADGMYQFVTIGYADEDPVEFTIPNAHEAMDHFMKALEAASHNRLVRFEPRADGRSYGDPH